MKQLKIKLATPDQAKEMVEWLNSTKGNLFDKGILTYPTLRTLCAYNGEAVAYLPMQRVLMLESLAVNPNSSLLERVQAFRDLTKGSELMASSDQAREIWMCCEDESVLRIAEGHGFERIPWPVVRMKL